MSEPLSKRGPFSENINVYFSDYFRVDPSLLEKYGAFNISLINDLPLFIDPFLLFASTKKRYQRLHEDMITYLKFLRDRSVSGPVSKGLVSTWYAFPEVSQLWLGFSLCGNRGSGLGQKFAYALNDNLGAVFSNFGEERITKSSHLEKVCLIADGVGRDNISDFTANLIKPFLCNYTQNFAQKHISSPLRRVVSVEKAYFDYNLQRWLPKQYELPFYKDDYVLLTPKDLLTREDNWINRAELLDGLEQIAMAAPDIQLRQQLENYLRVRLNEKMKKEEKSKVYSQAIKRFPEIIEHYILQKEETKERALEQSEIRVEETESLFIRDLKSFVNRLYQETDFYRCGMDTLEESRARIMFLKHVIEEKGGYRLFYRDGKTFQRESDLQILFKLTWFASPSDFNSEVNNGTGPVDFKVSRGGNDMSLVEFKLAKNRKLEQNLQAQVESYKKANRTEKALKVIFFFSEQELLRVNTILKRLHLESDPDLILIDVRNDNKPSGSNAKAIMEESSNN